MADFYLSNGQEFISKNGKKKKQLGLQHTMNVLLTDLNSK